MTRAQFLNELYRRLGALTREQAEQHLTYYAEMLADRMEEGMSEEEAVASMEDVETIAGRILQEETVQPPQYPETHVAEKKSPEIKEMASFNWRRPARIALWALALLMAGGMIFKISAQKSFSKFEDYGATKEPVEEVTPIERVDSGISIGPDGIQVGGISIGPDGIFLNGEEMDDDDWSEVNWAGDYTVWGEEVRIPIGEIEKIEVEWLAGNVEIFAGDSEFVFREASTRELDQKDQMTYQVKDETLKIKFWGDKHTRNNREDNSKLLILTIPSGLLDKLNVDTVSADVSLNSLEVNKLEVDTVSGNVMLSGLSALELDVQTVSGDIADIYQLNAQEIEAETASGDIHLELTHSTPSEVKLTTISGDAMLDLLETMGFSLEFKTISGDLNTGEFQLSIHDKKYVSGDGSCEIEVETTSGDLMLLTEE